MAKQDSGQTVRDNNSLAYNHIGNTINWASNEACLAGLKGSRVHEGSMSVCWTHKKSEAHAIQLAILHSEVRMKG